MMNKKDIIKYRLYMIKMLEIDLTDLMSKDEIIKYIIERKLHPE